MIAKIYMTDELNKTFGKKEQSFNDSYSVSITHIFDSNLFMLVKALIVI
jgi:hypothetical protein